MKEDIAPGTKHDQQKEDWSLLPYDSIREIVRVLDFGKKKYAAWNWTKVDNARDRYFAALMRHLYAWRSGESVDEESGLLHLAHAATDIVFLLWFELRDAGVRSSHVVQPGFGPDSGA